MANDHIGHGFCAFVGLNSVDRGAAGSALVSFRASLPGSPPALAETAGARSPALYRPDGPVPRDPGSPEVNHGCRMSSVIVRSGP